MPPSPRRPASRGIDLLGDFAGRREAITYDAVPYIAAGVIQPSAIRLASTRGVKTDSIHSIGSEPAAMASPPSRSMSAVRSAVAAPSAQHGLTT